MTSSSRELLEALRNTRADATVSSVLNNSDPSWMNMNQSPPRTLLRDQVDAREMAGVRNWLIHHQSHLAESEKRRVDNRLRAQEAFEQSQAELSALRQELERSQQYPLLVSQPTPRAFSMAEMRARRRQSVAAPALPQVSEIKQEVPQPEVSLHVPAESVNTNASVVPEQPIGTARDLNLLKEAISSRDDMIERLQDRLQSDKDFYQAQIQRMRDDADEAAAEANAKITGLRAQLEIALQNNRLVSDVTVTASSKEALEAKIAELRASFQHTSEGLRDRTESEIRLLKQDVERRLSEIQHSSEIAINSAKQVFNSERYESLALSQERLLQALAREHESALKQAEASVITSLGSRILTDIGEVVESSVKRTLSGEAASDRIEHFLCGEVRSRVLQALEDDLDRIVSERSSFISEVFKKQSEEAQNALSNTAANFAGIDSKGIDHVLTTTQAEFSELRHSAERAANIQEIEHITFMSRAKGLLERVLQTKKHLDRYEQAQEV